MTAMPDHELEELRKRAYGPSSDIHLDPGAVQRLRDLEEAVRPPAPPRAPVEPTAPIVVPEVLEEHAPAGPSRWMLLFAGLWRWMRGVRRSTWLISLGAAALAAVLATTLVVVQRVQSDPLLTGAQQVARLSLDTGYETPPFFLGYPANEGADLPIYQEFHGLRAAITTGGLYGGSPDGVCLVVFSEADADASTENSFSGALRFGCNAGAFPALTQFNADDQQLPEQLGAAFPDSTGLQFVYDAAHNEVVVFADKSPN